MQSLEHPAFFIGIDNTPFFLPQQPDYDAMMNYFDLGEILDFAEGFHSRQLCPSPGPVTYHTFHTKNNFIYNIVFMSECQDIKGTLISGPILLYSPDEKRLEEILSYNKMPLFKKPDLREILKSIPQASMEEIDHSGRLLLALCTSDSNVWALSKPVVHGLIGPDIEALFSNMTSTYVYGCKRNVEYSHLYLFIANLRKKIINGDCAELTDLLHKSMDILWSLESSGNSVNSLKNNCRILCFLSCIYAVRGKAPLELMFHIYHNFLEKIELTVLRQPTGFW